MTTILKNIRQKLITHQNSLVFKIAKYTVFFTVVLPIQLAGIASLCAIIKVCGMLVCWTIFEVYKFIL